MTSCNGSPPILSRSPGLFGSSCSESLPSAAGRYQRSAIARGRASDTSTASRRRDHCSRRWPPSRIPTTLRLSDRERCAPSPRGSCWPDPDRQTTMLRRCPWVPDNGREGGSASSGASGTGAARTRSADDSRVLAQARGRNERNFGTWQGRLPQELRLPGITTLEAANRFLRERYIVEFNRAFRWRRRKRAAPL
jgi:hypothetical protein